MPLSPVRTLATAVVILAVSAASALAASFTVYTDRTSFNAAAAPNQTEDFNSATLQPFAFGTPYGFNGFTITTTATGVSPFIPAGISSTTRSDIDGTQRLVWGQNAFTGGRDGPDILFTFTTPLTAFGFDWRNTDSTDSYKLVIGTTEFGAANTADPWRRALSRGFFGIVSDTPFTSLTLIHVTKGGVLNDMSMDNIAMTALPTAAIPLPPALPLLAVSVVALFGVARRRVG